jgi:hypothetical protein
MNLREAAQEAVVAWCDPTFAEDMASDGRAFVYASPGNVTTPARLFAPLYASPPARTPMTDEQIDTLHRQYNRVLFSDELDEIVRAVERHHHIYPKE